MKMVIKMKLMSDIIFGNGMSVPGAEDISVLHDQYGFPYYKGSTFKGVVRENYERYLGWLGDSESEIENKCNELFGNEGDDLRAKKLRFSDFVLSPNVKKTILNEVGENKPNEVLEILTNIRTFTSIDGNGVAKEGSLRMARSVDKDLCFYSEVECDATEKEKLKEVIESIKWLGSMRNRGFGKVKLTVEEG